MGTIDRSINARASTYSYYKDSEFAAVVNVSGRDITMVRVRSGTSNPNYKMQIKNLQNATTGLTGTFDTLSSKKLRAKYKYIYEPIPGRSKDFEYNGDYVLKNGIWDPTILDPSLSISKALNGAKSKFYKRIRAEQVSLSGPTFFGELGETLRMLRRPLAALHSKSHGYLDSLSKAKRSNPRNWMQTAGGLWLEQSFGWAPLMNDIKDAALAYRRLGKLRKAKPITVSFIDTADQSGTLQTPFNHPDSFFPYGLAASKWFYYGKKIDKVVVRFKGMVYAQTDQTPVDKAALFGFTPSEFIPTAWELMPWSFLADYFSNVGDILTATVTDTSIVAWVNRTIHQSQEAELGMYEDVSGTNLANPGWTRASGGYSGGTCNMTRRIISRAQGDNADLLSLPRFQLSFDLGAGQLGNIAALLSQASGLHPQRPPRNWHR